MLMDLVAGDAREILLAIGIDDWAGLHDAGRFSAYLSLGGRMDPGWLDLFARAARDVTASPTPADFSDSLSQLESRQQSRLVGIVDRNVERVDPHWVDDVAALPPSQIDRIAARWIDLIELEECAVDADDKPILREAAGDLVEFCRRARDAEDVLLAWSI
jgi:hypothetical protein